MNNELSSYVEMWIAIFKAMHQISTTSFDIRRQREYESYFETIGAHFGIVRDRNGISLGEKYILKRQDNTVVYIDTERKIGVVMSDGRELLHKAVDNSTITAIRVLEQRRQIELSQTGTQHHEELKQTQ